MWWIIPTVVTVLTLVFCIFITIRPDMDGEKGFLEYAFVTFVFSTFFITPSALTWATALGLKSLFEFLNL